MFRWWGVGTGRAAATAGLRSLSSVPVVGCRNMHRVRVITAQESIKCSGGGVSEPCSALFDATRRVYQVFRWWGVGTRGTFHQTYALSLSSVPVVGCRNENGAVNVCQIESIKCSGGGVSEPWLRPGRSASRVYQVFRWWGVGTRRHRWQRVQASLSSVPVVGCRNKRVCRTKS